MRPIPPIIIISGGIIVPPMIAHAIAGWSGVVGLYLACGFYIAWLAWGAPLQDELFPPEDISPAARGPEASAVELEPGHVTNLNATATHEDASA